MVILLMICLAVVSVASISRTITDTSDNSVTFIRNSNGNYWEANGANIQIAIDNLGDLAPPNNGGYGGPHGTVWLPGNTTLTITSTIIVKDYVTLDMCGCEIKPSGNIDVFLLHKGAQVRNGVVNVSGVGNYNSGVITLYALDGLNFKSHLPVIEDMIMVSSSQRGKAIYLSTSGTATQFTCWVHFNNIQIEQFEYGIFINHAATSGDNYINGNMFTNINIDDTKYCIKVYEAKAEASGNFFENIKCSCTSNTEYILWNNGHGNQFDNIQAFNWDNNSGTRKAYSFTGGYAGDWSGPAHSCYLCFRGGGNDILLPTWNQWYNAYTILDLEHGELKTGRVTEYHP